METLKVETLRRKDFKSKILTVLWELKKNGRADATIKNIGKRLRVLAKSCDLDNPEQVKTFIAILDRKNGYKKALTFAYDNYVKIHGLQWQRPNYWVASKLPKIPLESQIDLIISNASLKLATAISISKDTGLRPIELVNLKVKDIDLTKGAVYPETAKHGSPRILKIQNTTLNLLNKYLASRHFGVNDKLFTWWNSHKYGQCFRETRNKVAKKMCNESIKSIRLYDLRHFFATMLYKRTKDILFVRQQLGHRNIKNTLKYTQLLQFENDDNYTCKVAQNAEQATQLIENGFEYVATTPEGLMLFRKRK